MTTIHEDYLSRLKKIYDEKSPSHYGTAIASRNNTDLKNWLISITPDDCTSLTERMFIVLDGNNPHICKHNERKPYSLGKFRFCEHNCKCFSENAKIAAQHSRDTRIAKYGTYWTAEMQEKAKDTSFEKWGADHHLKSEEGKEKFKQIIQEKYGPDITSTAQLESVKETARKNNLEKYGVEYTLQIEEIRNTIVANRIENNGAYWTPEMQEKAKNTSLENWGTECYLQSMEGKEKFKQAIQEKYGPDITSTAQLESVKETARKNNLEKYGVENPIQLAEIQEKIKQANLEKYGVKYTAQRHILLDKLDILHDDAKFTEMYNSYDATYKIMEYIGVNRSTINHRAQELGLPRKLYTVSQAEQEIVDFLSQYTTVEQSDRTLLSPKEIDIVLPEYKIGIEYNGLYHHSVDSGRDDLYHLNKTDQMETLGYKLIHIFSDEWTYKQEIVKSRLLNIINETSNKIYARKTDIVELSSKEASDFLNENHIQGSCNSKYRYGLMYNNQLVSVMTFGKSRFNKNHEWELLRFCNTLNTTVVGGAGKLLSHFVKLYGSSIISYADRRWSNGNLYLQLGFDFIGNSTPSYFYINKDKRETRHKYQKHKLASQLEHFDNNLSEQENMKNNGFSRIYDCGNSVWVYKEKLGNTND